MKKVISFIMLGCWLTISLVASDQRDSLSLSRSSSSDRLESLQESNDLNRVYDNLDELPDNVSLRDISPRAYVSPEAQEWQDRESRLSYKPNISDRVIEKLSDWMKWVKNKTIRSQEDNNWSHLDDPKWQAEEQKRRASERQFDGLVRLQEEERLHTLQNQKAALARERRVAPQDEVRYER